MTAAYFSADTFGFLRELAANNNRAWFEQHKERYEAQLRGPALRLIADMSEPLRSISPQFQADARKVGGSLFRIQRDVRFSKDKTPYKTHIGIRFTHAYTRDVHSPLFYLHIEEGGSFAGGGLWRPDGKQLQRLREFIIANPNGWKQATRSAAFKRRFSMGGDSLKRPPRGFDPEHELLVDLKRKDFVASAPMSDTDILSKDLGKRLLTRYQGVAALVEYLCDALEIPY